MKLFFILIILKKLIIYCDGVFDLFHFGHAKAFEQIKKMYPDCYLIVGIQSDENTKNYKGVTVMNEQERANCIKHCKWVDDIIIGPPWIVDQEFIDKYNIDYLAHDVSSYPTGSPNDVHKYVKEIGKFLPIERTKEKVQTIPI